MLVRQKLESIPITVDSESTKQLLRSSHRAPSLARALPSRDFRCAAPSLKSEASPLFRSSHRAVAAAAPPRLFHTELTPTDRRSYCRCISEESVRWYFTTGPSDRCSSESSGTDSPAERPLSQPHFATGLQSLSPSASSAATPRFTRLTRHECPQCTVANRARQLASPFTSIAPAWVLTNVKSGIARLPVVTSRRKVELSRWPARAMHSAATARSIACKRAQLPSPPVKMYTLHCRGWTTTTFCCHSARNWGRGCAGIDAHRFGDKRTQTVGKCAGR